MNQLYIYLLLDSIKVETECVVYQCIPLSVPRVTGWGTVSEILYQGQYRYGK